ncbi:hypothetical protein CWATWH8502_1340 [Crocosphaera watsonii WH 8502]|uniref:Uncharacterized protein n=1 Tax=Crocosphaera watsonii WH 8502 TaxID=423474 RepID=T2IK09_CROWT|nr:hypothetical protein CWATWH8502_1340 [Crocosphaera watsonii WH 8502]
MAPLGINRRGHHGRLWGLGDFGDWETGRLREIIDISLPCHPVTPSPPSPPPPPSTPSSLSLLSEFLCLRYPS